MSSLLPLVAFIIGATLSAGHRSRSPGHDQR